MGTEIERKFLVRDEGWRHEAAGVRCRQGYLCPGSGVTVRVRVMGEQGWLTIKGAGQGISRREYEYPIPVAEAEEMLESLCKQPIIDKKRYTLAYQGMEWVVDEFFGANEGLVMAEVELEREDQHFLRPAWVGREVTGDPRFFNAALVNNPYKRWKK